MAEQWPGVKVGSAEQWPGVKVGGAEDEDSYRKAARAEMEAQRAKGASPLYGRARQFLQGATFGLADEALALTGVPYEMGRIFKETGSPFSPVEAYNRAKAREDIELEDARQRGGWLGAVAELVGGIGTGAGAARAGLTTAGRFGDGLAGRAASAAADGAIYGGIVGAAEGSGEGRLGGAAMGAATGAGVGAGLVGAGAVARPVWDKAGGFIQARVNPEGFTDRQLARVIQESGQTPQQMTGGMAGAALDNQGQVWTVADQLGNAGQRMLSTIARSPGESRTRVVNTLEGRQAEQGRRIANTLAEGFDSPQTAAQAQEVMAAARAAEAQRLYGQARANAGPVDVSPALMEVDRTLAPGVTGVMRPQTQIADDTIEGVLRRARGMLADERSQLTDFNAALRAKHDIDDIIARAAPRQQQALIPVRQQLDDALAAASPDYAAARDAYRAQSQAIEAIETGRAAARRGRTEDTVPRFQALSAPEQQGFRVGYVDPLIEQVQGAAVGVNKARPFTSQAMQTELPAFAAPGRAAALRRRLDRENTMFETRAHATGGSRTADNLADEAALSSGVSPEVIGNLLSGNAGWGTAIRAGLGRASSAAGGYTPAVRDRLADILLATSQQGIPNVGGRLNRVMENEARRRLMLANALRGVETAASEQASQRRE